MNQLIKMDEEYRKWIEDIGKRYKQRQIKASVSVNQEMIGFYWSIGKDIVEKSAGSKWGSGFFVNLSKDMRTILPGVQGLSSSNLRYMKKFYELYSDPILPQFVEELKSKEDSINVPQLVGDLSDKELFSIPWGHHRAIIDKCKLDREKSIFFVKKTIFNEDMIFASHLIEAGKKIAYAADAKVWHWHNYTAKDQLKRNFDLAVSQVDAGGLFTQVKSESEGIRLVKMTLKHFIKKGQFYYIPKIITQNGAKYIGYRLGKNYKKLPKKWILKISLNPWYWK